MIYTSESIERVVEYFSNLPSIGRKTAYRLTMFLLNQNSDFIEKFAQSLINLKQNIKYCSQCYNFTELDPCPICRSEKRNKSIICVVEEPADVNAIEKTNEYHGLYHVLQGVINPLENISPDDLKIRELLQRIKSDTEEVILALNPSTEGEVTTQYLTKILKPLGIKVTRIARGVPMGLSLEFADEATLSRAIQGRVEV